MFIDNLKATHLFIENEYFKKYIQLIEANLKTKQQKFKTQRHHIIPATAFDLYNWSGKNDKANLVSLLYKDHILAHYYLALCSASTEFKYKMICAINFILGNASLVKLDVEELKVFTASLEKYQELYEESKRHFAEKLRGTTHDTSEETKQKISKANGGRIYVNKDEVVRSIQPEDLDLYLSNGWVRGNPNAAKRNTGKGKTIVNKDSIERFIDKAELEKYLAEGWSYGRSAEHKQATKTGTQKYYNKLTAEERKAKCASRTGQHWNMSDEWKKKISKANKGRKCSEAWKLKNSQNKKGTIHMTNGINDVMIKPEREQEFIKLGYHRGRSKNRKKKRNEK